LFIRLLSHLSSINPHVFLFIIPLHKAWNFVILT
jgi:hypothetical protein